MTGSGERVFSSLAMTTVLKPIRSKVYEGARQPRPAAELGHPLVVVLTNPHDAPSPGGWACC